jgi:hypothetical protein
MLFQAACQGAYIYRGYKRPAACDDIFVQTCLDQNFTQIGKGLL